jgi:hypothetical protein
MTIDMADGTQLYVDAPENQSRDPSQGIFAAVEVNGCKGER